jgi:hypothetical protein
MSKKRRASDRESGKWELIYKRLNEAMYQTRLDKDRELILSNYGAPQSLESDSRLKYNTLLEVSDKGKGSYCFYLFGDNFIKGDMAIKNGTPETSSLDKARAELTNLIGNKYWIQSLFTDESLPKAVQKRVRNLWNY